MLQEKYSDKEELLEEHDEHQDQKTSKGSTIDQFRNFYKGSSMDLSTMAGRTDMNDDSSSINDMCDQNINIANIAVKVQGDSPASDIHRQRSRSKRSKNMPDIHSSPTAPDAPCSHVQQMQQDLLTTEEHARYSQLSHGSRRSLQSRAADA